MTNQGERSTASIEATLGVNKSGGTGRRSGRRLVWLVLLAAAGYGLFQLSQWRAKAASQVQFVTEPIKSGDLTVTVSATGTLQPTDIVDVGIEVSGTVESVEVDYNDTVKAGQVLARLDTSKLRAQVLQSEAALEASRARVLQAQANVREATANLDRLKELRYSNPDLVSRQSLDTAQAAYDRAQAEVATATATVRQSSATLEGYRTELSKAVIVSPIDGVVLNRAVNQGQTVVASFQSPVLFRLAEDLTQLELQADIDEADVGKVREGQIARFTVDAFPDREFTATITQLRIGSQAVEGVVTYKAIMEVSNPDRVLRPGMTATAQIIVQEVKNAMLVPNAALRFKPPTQDEEKSSFTLMSVLPKPTKSMIGGESAPETTQGDQIWTLRDGKPVAVPVTLGSSDGDFTAVSGEGVVADMPVIVDVKGTP